MAKFKTGDVLKPLACSTGFLHPFLDPQELYTVKGCSGGFVNVSGKFLGGGGGFKWSEDWFEPAESEAPAESLRSSILDIRSKREELQKEILQLDEQEKETIEKLKELGFVLYEDNAAKELEVKELVVTEKKTVLYAEDIEEDMTDPHNWQVGDILEQEKYWFKDKLTPITEIGNEGWWTRDNDSPGASTYGTYNDVKSHFKFHSRPVK